ncbi:sulfite exporter TauE/SafE family protein [Pasteurella multocida]
MGLQLILILIVCGVLTNFMSAIFGIGGGVLMVPILYTLFPDFPLQMVAATSLTIVIASSLINLIYFYKQKIQINFKAMLLWSVGMIIGVQLGFEASFYLPDTLIVIVFISVLTILAIRTIFHSKIVKTDQAERHENLKGAGLCLFGGGVAGMTGIGGGSIMAPLIGQLNSVKPHQIAPYTNYMMVIGGLGSLYGYLSKTPPFHLDYGWQIGYVNFSVVTIVVLSSFVTSFISMKIRGLLHPDVARKMLGLILLAIAAYMLIAHLLK